MEHTMWLVRADSGGRLARDFFEKSVVAIGWPQVGSLSSFKTRAEVISHVGKIYPNLSKSKVINAASQLFRFSKNIKIGDYVVSYENARRSYLVGKILSEANFDNRLIEDFPNYRKVDWLGEVSRDELSVQTKNSLGSILTLFQIPKESNKEIISLLSGKPQKEDTTLDNIIEEQDLLRDMQDKSKEFMKDKVNKLDWDQMQELVAGLLRAMGYKTRISPSGPDRGKDIVASPDGFGFESPRIIVEVKHRKGSMGAPQVRSFTGVLRHDSDKGLYVSTGGFTKEAYYEAERAHTPITLMNLDDLVEALTEYYEKMDATSRALLPLTTIYWPL